MVVPPVATEFRPLILTNAGLKISTDGTTANLKELACLANHIELAPDTTVTTVDTMCGSTDYAGVVKWTLIATLYQSFDVDATEDVLSQAFASGAPVAFEVIGYRDQPISASNPAWSGLVDPRQHPPINGDAGAVSEIALEWGVIGQPVKTTTAGGGTLSASTSSSSTPAPAAA